MRTLGVLVAVAASVAAFSVTGSPAATGACKVPKLTGLKTADARAALRKAGCPTALVTATACAARTKVGIIVDQKPRPKLVLAKGRKVSVHVGRFCPPEPPPPPPPPAAPPDFVGDFTGSYTGLLVGSGGCPDIPIKGAALVRIEQLTTSSYDVLFALENAHVVTGEQCIEIARDTTFGEEVTSATGNKLVNARLTVTIDGDTITGKFQVRAGEFTFTATRA
jgi:PASTA domain-containing protein